MLVCFYRRPDCSAAPQWCSFPPTFVSNIRISGRSGQHACNERKDVRQIRAYASEWPHHGCLQKHLIEFWLMIFDPFIVVSYPNRNVPGTGKIPHPAGTFCIWARGVETTVAHSHSLFAPPIPRRSPCAEKKKQTIFLESSQKNLWGRTIMYLLAELDQLLHHFVRNDQLFRLEVGLQQMFFIVQNGSKSLGLSGENVLNSLNKNV